MRGVANHSLEILLIRVSLLVNSPLSIQLKVKSSPNETTLATSPKLWAYFSGLVLFEALGEHLPVVRAHSLLCRHQSFTRHPQIAQFKQRQKLDRVLGKTLVAHLGEAELALDYPKRVLHFGASHGTTRFISSRNSRLRALLVTNSNLQLAKLFCFIGN